MEAAPGKLQAHRPGKRRAGNSREGDVAGSEIPAIYFDYLRTGDARGLQPVFYHNALDIITLAALTVELARALGDAGTATLDSPLDLFSLSRMYEIAGSREQSVATCQRALSRGLPEEIEARALHQLALQYKRQHQHELAVETWLELTRRASPLALEAFEELAIHYEHHRRDPQGAMEFTLSALERLREDEPQSLDNRESALPPSALSARFTHRLERLRRKTAKLQGTSRLPMA